MSLQGLRFTLDVNGLDADTFAVVSFGLKQYLSVPFTLDVDVASQKFDLQANNLLEKNATLTIWQGTRALRFTTGVITSFAMKENNRWQMQYHLCIQSPIWRCCLRQNFRIYQQQDIQNISATFLEENGITVFVLRCQHIRVAYYCAPRRDSESPCQCGWIHWKLIRTR